jgi:hypothetical protein
VEQARFQEQIRRMLAAVAVAQVLQDSRVLILHTTETAELVE